jgi:hypothetical protein
VRRRPAGARSWLASHPVEIVFALLVAVAFAYSLRITRQSYFFSDDWRLITQAGSLRGMFRPYNDHLSIIILSNYRALVEVFGFAYTPFRVLGLLGLFAVPVGYFATTRRQFGAPLAALLAMPLVWYGKFVSLNASEYNHYLALLGGIGCAAALNRGRRADWVLAVALAFSLCSAGGGVAVAAACLVHHVCTRPPLRRWLAVVIPTLVWLGWWLIVVGHTSNLGRFALSTSEKVRFVRDLAYTPFESAALGFAPLAFALMVAVGAYGIWSLTKGLTAGANVLAWAVGLLVWAVGVANSRGVLARVDVFRYRYVALGMVLLAVVPRRPIGWPARFPITTDRRWLVAGAGVVLALGSARAVAVRSDMQSSATVLAQIGRSARGSALVVELGSAVIADDVALPRTLGGLRAGDVRALFAHYGRPFPTTQATVDRQLVDMGLAHSFADGTRTIRCKPLTRPFLYQPRRPFWQFVWAPNASVTVEVRLFGGRWVRLAQARSGQALRLVLPDLGVAQPWRIRAIGACRVGPRRT